MVLLGHKLIAIAVLLIENLTFVLLPVFNKKFKTNKALMSFVNSFAGGIFVAAGLIHLLPHALDIFNAEVSLASLEHLLTRYRRKQVMLVKKNTKRKKLFLGSIWPLD